VRVFARPSFFDSVGNSQELSPALLFGVLVVWISTIIIEALLLIFQAPFLLIMPQAGIVGAFGVVGLACFSLFSWLPVLLGILIYGLIIHLFLMLFGGANQGLRMTLRVISYACAPQIFIVVPLAGSCIAGIWMLILEIIGLAAAHRTDTWRAVLAILAPIILFACVVAIFYGAVIAAIISGLQRP